MSAMSSSPSDIRESVSQARQAVIEAERAVQAARDEALLAVTSFDTAMRHQMEAAINHINRGGKDALTDEMVVEVIAHYLSKSHQNSTVVEPKDHAAQYRIIRAVEDALRDTYPWIKLHARMGVVIETALPLDRDYAKALPAFLGELFVALDRYVVTSDIDTERRPAILFNDDQARTIFIRASKSGGVFSVNPALLDLETPIGARTFEEVVNMLPGLVRKTAEKVRERQVKKPWWSGFPLAG